MSEECRVAARMNILLTRFKSIGDVLFTLPAVNAVRDNFPSAKIHFLVSKENAPILRGFAEVDEIIPVDRSMYRPGNVWPALKDTARLLSKLRHAEYSMAIDFQGYAETEYLTWWTGAAERWGTAYKRSRGWLFTQIAARDVNTHPVEWNLSVLRRAGLHVGSIRNDYVLPADAWAEARKNFVVNGLDEKRPTLFIQPFTSNSLKNWPLERFLALARHFNSNGIQIIFGGGPRERDRLKPVQEAGFVVAAGAPLLVSAGFAGLSTVVLGADTGLLHVAVAMGRRVVMLMYSNAPGSSHPAGHPEWAVVPSHGRELSAIDETTVIRACSEALAGRPQAGG